VANGRVGNGTLGKALRIRVNFAALRESKWHEYLARFVFGGMVTVAAGLVAKHYGPEIGGLFLAFPAIFPAAATLLEKHEKQAEHSKVRARELAGIDAAGAAIGSLGLMVFGFVVWRGLEHLSLGFALGVATAGWLVAAVGAWWIRKVVLRHFR